MDRALVKATGRAAFKANYMYCVVMTLILGLTSGGGGASYSISNSFKSGSSDADASTATDMLHDENFWKGFLFLLPLFIGFFLVALTIGLALRFLFLNPLQVGALGFFRANIMREDANVSMIGIGFKRDSYKRNVASMFYQSLFVFLWSLLFIIPGIVKSYSYMLVPYILAEDPSVPAMEALKRSEQIMEGHKMEAFILDLSFIGWHLLSVLTLGILELFYVAPYQHSTNAAYYTALLGQTPRNLSI